MDTAAWWRGRADDAFTTLLRLDKRRLPGVNITSQTAAALRIAPKTVRPITRVSPDGRSFPHEPADFKAEVLAQLLGLLAQCFIFVDLGHHIKRPPVVPPPT
jgi:hypothetical protein